MRLAHLWIGFIECALAAFALTFTPPLDPNMPTLVSMIGCWVFMAAATVFAGRLSYLYTANWLVRRLVALNHHTNQQGTLMLAWQLWSMATAVVVSTPLFLFTLTGAFNPGAAVAFTVLLVVCLAGLGWSFFDATRTRRAATAERAAGEVQA